MKFSIIVQRPVAAQSNSLVVPSARRSRGRRMLPPGRRLQPILCRALFFSLAAVTLALFGSGRLSAQINGAWSDAASGGLWSSANSWQGGNVANGTGASADFTQLTLPGNNTVHLDSLRTVGSLIFGDQGHTYNWTLDNNGSSSNTLTLATTSGSPTITVNNDTATMSVAVIGTNVIASVAGGATLKLAGSVSDLNQGVNIANNGTLLDSSSVNQNVGAVTGSGNTVVNSGGSLTAYQIRQNSLTISGSAVVTLKPSGSGSVGNPTGPNNINFSSSVTSLSIGGTLNAWTGTLDIGNNGLVIAYGSGADQYATIQNMVQSGYNGGIWGGTGITSSLAAASINGGHPLNIGLAGVSPPA